MIDCKKCQKTSCAKQVAKQNLTIFFCTGYKKMEQLSTVQNQSKRKIKKKEKQA